MHTVATLVCQTWGKYRKNIGNAGQCWPFWGGGGGGGVHVTASSPKVFKV